jgi:hypothetical protein
MRLSSVALTVALAACSQDLRTDAGVDAGDVFDAGMGTGSGTDAGAMLDAGADPFEFCRVPAPVSCRPTLTEHFATAGLAACRPLVSVQSRQCADGVSAIFLNTEPTTSGVKVTCWYAADGGTLLGELTETDSNSQCWGEQYASCQIRDASPDWHTVACTDSCTEPQPLDCPPSSGELIASCRPGLRREDANAPGLGNCWRTFDSFSWTSSGTVHTCIYDLNGGALAFSGSWGTPSASFAPNYRCWGSAAPACVARPTSANTIACDGGM